MKMSWFQLFAVLLVGLATAISGNEGVASLATPSSICEGLKSASIELYLLCKKMVAEGISEGGNGIESIGQSSNGVAGAGNNICGPVKLHHVFDASTKMESDEELKTRIGFQFIFQFFFNLQLGTDFTTAASIFSDKASLTENNTDTCYTAKCSQAAGLGPMIGCWEDLMNTVDAQWPLGNGGNDDGGSQMDALMGALKAPWDDSYPNKGQKFVMMTTYSVAETSSLLPSFDGTLDCENYNYPTVADIKQAAIDEDAYIIIITKHEDVYNSLFASLGDRVIVGSLGYSLWPKLMKFVADATCVNCEPCDSHLQMLHLQDISSSYFNSPNIVHAKNLVENVMLGLEGEYNVTEFALGSFSDKPIAPAGYSTDYCYRDDYNFTSVVGDVLFAYDKLKKRSGRSWRESQLDAFKYGMLSPNLGWIRSNTYGGRCVQRVVVLVTDALPHVKGFFPNLGSNNGSCELDDYPSYADIGKMLTDDGFFAVIISTNDVFGRWRSYTNAWNRKTFRLTSPSADIVNEIKNAL